MQRFRVVLRKENKGVVDGIGMAGEGQREMGQVVDVDLRLVGACGALTLSVGNRRQR